jgi:hypothetical protein
MRQHTSAYVSIRQCGEMQHFLRQHLAYTAYVSIRQHSIRQHTSAFVERGPGGVQESEYASIRQHTSAYVSIRQHTSAYVSIRQHTPEYTPAYVSKAHTCAPYSRSERDPGGVQESAYVSIRQHTSAYVSKAPTCAPYSRSERDPDGVQESEYASIYVSIRQQGAYVRTL